MRRRWCATRPADRRSAPMPGPRSWNGSAPRSTGPTSPPIPPTDAASGSVAARWGRCCRIACMPTRPAVSIVVPLFGDHAGNRTLALAAATWLEQTVPCELVVAASGPPPDGLPEHERVRVVARNAAAPGRLRNAAARVSNADFLYLCDADVAPLGEDFLARLLELLRESGSTAVCQPWMYRLVDGHD